MDTVFLFVFYGSVVLTFTGRAQTLTSNFRMRVARMLGENAVTLTCIDDETGIAPGRFWFSVLPTRDHTGG